MTKVKIQKKPSGNYKKGQKRRAYFTYMITLPRQLVESSKFKDAKEIEVTIKDNRIILIPK